jgi:hypothetical protein
MRGMQSTSADGRAYPRIGDRPAARGAMTKRAASTAPKVAWSWQLKIELLDVTPIVWRRVTVPETIKLPKLHQVFQTALGWTNSHLHEFIIGGVRYAELDPDFADEVGQVEERGIALHKAGRDARCFDYVYDFGDNWHHVIIVENQLPHPGVVPSLIHCSGGQNACPPEDVGGSHGYAEFLAAIADPNHEEHERYLEWRGDHFDFARFDPDAVNLSLSKIKP